MPSFEASKIAPTLGVMMTGTETARWYQLTDFIQKTWSAVTRRMGGLM